MQLSNLKDWVILGQFHWSAISQLFKLSCAHTNWMSVAHLGDLLDIGISDDEVNKHEDADKIDFRKADKDHYWVACKESEKEQLLKYLNEQA